MSPTWDCGRESSVNMYVYSTGRKVKSKLAPLLMGLVAAAAIARKILFRLIKTN